MYVKTIFHFAQPCAIKWPVLRGERSTVNSPHKGQWRGALMFSLKCAWTDSWANNGHAGAWWQRKCHQRPYNWLPLVFSADEKRVVIKTFLLVLCLHVIRREIWMSWCPTMGNCLWSVKWNYPEMRYICKTEYVCLHGFLWQSWLVCSL